jgi:hypothetical protein
MEESDGERASGSDTTEGTEDPSDLTLPILWSPFYVYILGNRSGGKGIRLN